MRNYQRIMGLDVGSHTVGVAISDLMGWTAQGLTTLKIDEAQENYGFDELLKLIEEHQVNKVIIGLPKNMDNSIGPRAQASLEYGEKLQSFSPQLTIIYQDERLTTTQAERMLVEEGNVSRKKRKHVIDKVAATLILQNYLDTHGH